MSVGGEISGVSLRYVAREIEGSIKTQTTKFDAKLGENITAEVNVKDPVIVFFPSGTSQVMPRKAAEQKGFLAQPDVMNLAMVEDSKTAAGRYKNAIREADRLSAWLEMENAVISRSISRTGHPLPLDCLVSEASIYFDYEDKKEKAA